MASGPPLVAPGSLWNDVTGSRQACVGYELRRYSNGDGTWGELIRAAGIAAE